MRFVFIYMDVYHMKPPIPHLVICLTFIFFLTFLVCSHLPDFYFSFSPVFLTDLETKYKKVTISSPSGKTDPQKPFSSLVHSVCLSVCLSLARSLALSLTLTPITLASLYVSHNFTVKNAVNRNIKLKEKGFVLLLSRKTICLP